MKKKICKKCEHCISSYQGGICGRTGERIRFYAFACEHFTEKQEKKKRRRGGK